MSVIAVDIDNTLYDFETIARDIFLEIAYERGDKSIQRGAYHPWTEWRSLSDSCGHDIALEVVNRCHSEEVVCSRTPFDGAVDTLWELAEDHELRYISTRAPETADYTEDWLWNIACVPEGRVVCTMDDKIPYLPDCQYLIDDRPKTIVEFIYNYDWKNKHGSNNAAKQRKAFALTFPCNLNLTDIPNLYLAPTWRGIRGYLISKGVLRESVSV